MKKRSLAVFLAVCVTLGSVLLPAGTETYADQISVGETEIEDTEMAEPTGESEADGNGETSTETEQAEKEEGTGNESTKVTESTETTEETETETEEETESTETEETERTETTETEETETTEEVEETETEEPAEEEDSLADVDQVSKVIGVSVVNTNNNKTIHGKAFCYVNETEFAYASEIYTYASPEKWYDEVTGLYLYRGMYFQRAVTDTTTGRLSTRVAAVLNEMPQKDEATGLYLVNGRYYKYYSKNQNGIYYVTQENEVDVLGYLEASQTMQEVYGKKLTADDTVAYYEANGKCYTVGSCGTVSLSDGKKLVYAKRSGEISFTKRYEKLTWKAIYDLDEISDGTHVYQIGYQIRINGKPAFMNTYAADGQMFYRGSSASYLTKEVFTPGETTTYEVRGIYYTTERKTETAADGTVTYEDVFHIAKTGAWSDPYTYQFSAQAKPQIPAVKNLTAVSKNRQAKLSWDEVTGGEKYYVYRAESDTRVSDPSSLEWKLLATIDGITTSYTTALRSTYTYYYVCCGITYETSIYEIGKGERSNIVEAVMDSDMSSKLTPLTGLTVDQSLVYSGHVTVTWDERPKNQKVYLFVSQDASVYQNQAYLADLVAAKGSYLYQAKTGQTKVVTYKTDDKIKQAYEIAKAKTKYKECYGNDGIKGVQLEVSTSKTNYIVAVVVDESNYENDRSATTPYVGNRIDSQGKSVEVHYGNYNDVAASDVITMETYVTTPPVPDLKSEKNKISMIFSPSNVANHITGHEIYRKNKKGKYQKVATTTSLQYTDTGLEEGKTYQYKVRVYVYQKEKKKKVYSGFVFFSAETSTKNYLDVIAVMTGKNSVKVKWNKVPGVTKYEVYRSSTSSKNTVDAAKTDGVLSNSKWKLIKTIKSAKTVSCTDKKLNTGETYSYLVCAYYKEGKDTKRILEGASVNLKLYPVTGITGKFKKDSLKMSWDKNYFAKKYELRYKLVEATGNTRTDSPVTVTTTKPNYTISSLQGIKSVTEVQIRAYDGKKWTAWSTKKTYDKMTLQAVKGVAANNVTVKNADGTTATHVKVSWKPVSGAAYYIVWRSTTPALYYQTDYKVYDGTRYLEMIAKESNQDEKDLYNQVYYTDYKNEKGSITETSAIDYADLSNGVTYYYFVKAYSADGKSSIGYAKPDVKVTYNVTAKIKSVKAKKGKVTLTFTKAAGAKKYQIYRSTKKNKGYQLIATTKKTTYIDKKVKKKKTYYYKVVVTGQNVVGADYQTGMSSPVKIKVK